MILYKRYLMPVMFLFIATLVTFSAYAQPDGRFELMDEYFDMVRSSNFESAAQMWDKDAYQRAYRFEISFENIPIKIDCGSPIIRNLDIMRDHLYRPINKVNSLGDGTFSRLSFWALANGQNVEHDYYSHYDGLYHWLTFPQDHYCFGWPTMTSRYLHVRYHPDRKDYLSPIILKAADDFIERMIDSLDIPEATKKLIAERKIEYFFCDSDERLEQITGHRVKGTTDLGSNDVISAFFPHYHEMVHLLVNIKLKKLPLYTHPLLREGLAVYYGGRWGKEAEVLFPLGIFMIDNKVIELDSILTLDGFEQAAGADIAYPVAGLFVSFLRSKMSTDDLLKVYRDFSGPIDALNMMSINDVKTKLVEETGFANWEELSKSFAEFTSEYDNKYTSMRPGEGGHTEDLYRDEYVDIRADGDWITIIARGDGSEPPAGNLMIGPSPAMQQARSIIYDDQYRDKDIPPGYRYGIRFDGNEAGFYDYATNTLSAKFISSLSPGNDYLSADGTKLTFRFKRSMLSNEPLGVETINFVAE